MKKLIWHFNSINFIRNTRMTDEQFEEWSTYMTHLQIQHLLRLNEQYEKILPIL